MGQARKDTRFKGVAGTFSGVETNIFYEMDGVHIQKVFELLTDRFGFPSQWQKNWKEHLENSPRGEDEIGLFLRWGTQHIQPILNAVLLRSPHHSTWAALCEHIIRQSRTSKRRS